MLKILKQKKDSPMKRSSKSVSTIRPRKSIKRMGNPLRFLDAKQMITYCIIKTLREIDANCEESEELRILYNMIRNNDIELPEEIIF